jgi:hypothetical protein
MFLRRWSKINGFFLCIVLATQSLTVFAFETDQYNLPPVALADIGDEVSDYVEENLRKAVDKINAEITALQSCLDKKPVKSGCGDSPDKERARLAFLRSEAAMTREVFKPLGGGFPPFTNSGGWMESHRFKAQPARYKTSYGKSIFRIFPINYLTVSATVNLYGTQMGTDKIAHFFQQGYTYLRIYERAVARGLSPAEAAQKAIRWGRMTENTYYGTLVSGIFSNADLCANFVGMKFYQNLTREIKIGEKTRPPILILKNGSWTFNENIEPHEALLKPFLSAHLNEALNPSILTPLFGFRSSARHIVEKNACRQWRRQYPNFSATDFAEITRNLKLWNGENYGFKDSEKFISLADTCFGEQKSTSQAK